MTAFLAINPSRLAIIRVLLRHRPQPMSTTSLIEETGLAHHIVSKQLLELESLGYLAANNPDRTARRHASAPARWVLTEATDEALGNLYDALFGSRGTAGQP